MLPHLEVPVTPLIIVCSRMWVCAGYVWAHGGCIGFEVAQRKAELIMGPHRNTLGRREKLNRGLLTPQDQSHVL